MKRHFMRQLLKINKMKNLIFFLAGIFLFISCAQKNENANVFSPEGKNTIQFELMDGVPYYSVKHEEKLILNPSKMGFVFSDGTFNSGLKIVEANVTSFDETWEQVWGEKRLIRNCYNQLVVKLEDKEKNRMEIQFRAFDDGVAFRYIFPGKEDSDSLIIMDEETEFALADNGDAWWIPAYRDNRYEYLYQKNAVSDLDTVHTPLTIKSNNGLYLSIHEAALIDYASMTLEQTEGNTLKCNLVPWSDGTKVKTTGSFKTPWRTIQIAEKPGDLITSYLILNLNEPNKLDDLSYIRPSKYLGIWWGMHISKYSFWEGEKHGASTENSKMYIDYCEKLGIDRLLIEGWNKGWTPAWYENLMHQFNFTQSSDDYNLEEVVKYGDSK